MSTPSPHHHENPQTESVQATMDGLYTLLGFTPADALLVPLPFRYLYNQLQTETVEQGNPEDLWGVTEQTTRFVSNLLVSMQMGRAEAMPENGTKTLFEDPAIPSEIQYTFKIITHQRRGVIGLQINRVSEDGLHAYRWAYNGGVWTRRSPIITPRDIAQFLAEEQSGIAFETVAWQPQKEETGTQQQTARTIDAYEEAAIYAGELTAEERAKEQAIKGLLGTMERVLIAGKIYFDREDGERIGQMIELIQLIQVAYEANKRLSIQDIWKIYLTRQKELEQHNFTFAVWRQGGVTLHIGTMLGRPTNQPESNPMALRLSIDVKQAADGVSAAIHWQMPVVYNYAHGGTEERMYGFNLLIPQPQPIKTGIDQLDLFSGQVTPVIAEE